MNQALVSVVMPAFNCERYIAECIDSVLEQTYQDFEIIIVDDGSTDDTVKIISQYKNDRIRLFNQSNSGSGSARNYGVKQASGEWVAFIDADDIWLPDKLHKQLEHCSKLAWSHTDLYFHGSVYPRHTKATEFTSKHSGFILNKLLVENFIGTSSVVIKKEIFQEFGGFNTELRALQDWDLWLRIAEKYQVCYIDQPLVYYRVHSSSVSRNVRKTLPYHISLIDRAFSQNGPGSQLPEFKNEALSRSCQICSQIAEQEQDYLFSCYCAARSLLYRPQDASTYSRLIKIMSKATISIFTNNRK
jgi:glycosyltransferase involved in cell wall biosynthesis